AFIADYNARFATAPANNKDLHRPLRASDDLDDAFAWKEERMSVSRPIELVVLNCWVTDTNDTPCASKISTSRAKSASERVSRSTLVDDDDIDPASLSVGEQSLECRPLDVASRAPAIVVGGSGRYPA